MKKSSFIPEVGQRVLITTGEPEHEGIWRVEKINRVNTLVSKKATEVSVPNNMLMEYILPKNRVQQPVATKKVAAKRTVVPVVEVRTPKVQKQTDEFHVGEKVYVYGAGVIDLGPEFDGLWTVVKVNRVTCIVTKKDGREEKVHPNFLQHRDARVVAPKKVVRIIKRKALVK